MKAKRFEFSLSSDVYPAVELLDHMVVLLSVFWGSSKLFSIVAAPFYNPTNSVLEFPFLYTHSRIYLQIFWRWPFWQVYEVTLLVWKVSA